MRLAQAHREAPALAGAQGLARLHERRVLVVAGVPAEREQARHAGRRPAPGIDFEAKAQPARPLLRQAGDDAGDDDVLAFELGRQHLGQAHCRLPSRRREAEPGRGGDRDERAEDAAAPGRARDERAGRDRYDRET